MSSTNLTAEILAILEEVAKVKHIKRYELKPDIEVEVGDGFLSNFYKGDIINKDTGESLRVAIKKVPKFEYDCEGIFSNEISFYSKVLPALKQLQTEVRLPVPFDNTPEYYSSSLDPANRYIALEHLQPKGYVLHDKKNCMNPDQLTSVFKIYGRFHALSFVLQKIHFEKYKQLQAGLKDTLSEFTKNDYTRNDLAKGLCEAANNLEAGTDAYKVAKKLFKDPLPTTEKAFLYNGDIKCLTHGDGWSNNMLFKYSKSAEVLDIKLIDFQLTRESTPVHDLSYFFYSSASKTDMSRLTDYLKIYHNTLSEVLKAFGQNPEEILPFDVLLREWKSNALMGVILGIYLWQLKLLNKEDYADSLKDEETGPEAVEKLMKFWEDLVAAVFKSDTYKTRTREILEHAFEFGVLTEDKAV